MGCGMLHRPGLAVDRQGKRVLLDSRSCATSVLTRCSPVKTELTSINGCESMFLIVRPSAFYTVGKLWHLI